MVNNLGGLSVLEMGIVTGEVLASEIGQRADVLVGPAALMTSLDMRGVSVTALSLDDSLRTGVLAAVGDGTAWVAGREVVAAPALLPYHEDADDSVAASDDPATRAALVAVCAALVDATARLDAADAKVGDGDTGSTFATAARRIQADLDALPLAEPAELMLRLSKVLSKSMGGSSGVLISIFLSRPVWPPGTGPTGAMPSAAGSRPCRPTAAPRPATGPCSTRSSPQSRR